MRSLAINLILYLISLNLFPAGCDVNMGEQKREGDDCENTFLNDI